MAKARGHASNGYGRRLAVRVHRKWSVARTGFDPYISAAGYHRCLRVAVTLELKPPIVVRTHATGAVYAFPLGDPTLVCRAESVADALSMQTLFLTEHLAKLPADRLASFTCPDDARLHEIPVEVPREDLARRFGIDRAIAIGCVAIPDRDAQWVLVLPLGVTVWVAPGESLERRVADEVVRQVGAREPSPAQWLRLLPAVRTELVRIDVRVKRNDHDDLGARASTRRARLGERSRTDARKLLESVGTDVLEAVAKRRPAQVVGRDAEIRRVAALLSGDERSGVALVGPPLAGKTAVFEGLLSQAIVPFRARPVFGTSGARIVAGQSGFGQLQERVAEVMRAAELLDAVLYFDNLADLFAGKSGGMEDLATALRPWIVEARVRIVGESTPAAFEQHEKQHATLLSCLHRVAIEPLDAATTRSLLERRNEHVRRRDPKRPTLATAAIAPLVELAERYLVDQAFPGKAVRLFDELRAVHEHDVDEQGRPHVISVPDVHRAFSVRTGIPMFLLRDDERMRRDALEQEFRRRVIGQHEAIRRVIETLCTIKARLQPPGKPLANFLFVGPTGIGKTEVAKTLARILFGAPDRLLRYDMSEYTDPYAAERLIRGSQRDDGELTRKVRQQPFCVVLLDEIEKAHPAVFDLLLQVLGEGRLTDARGQTTHFHNAIVIMTSNLGAAHRPRHGEGAGFARVTAADADAERRYYLEQVDRHFRPEFVNRIDGIIPFSSLDREEIARVARVSLERIRERGAFAERGVELDVGARALASLAEGGYAPQYGARALRRHLEDRLVAPIARLLAEAGADANDATVLIGADDDELTPMIAARELDPVLRVHADALALALVRRAGKRPPGIGSALARISRLRRNATATTKLTAIEDLRQRASYLTADLAGTPNRRGRDQATTLAAMREYQRIADSLARIDEAVRALEAVEELAVPAVAEGAPLDELLDEAELAHASFEITFVRALLEADPRNAITLLVRPTGGLMPWARWLRWLEAWSEERSWSVLVHRYDDRERGSDWPATLPWGPPRTLKWIHDAFARELELARWPALLVRVSGLAAGGLLAFEHGLQRFWRPDAATAEHLEVRHVVDRAEIGQLELAAPAAGRTSPFDPGPRIEPDQIHKLPAVREVFPDGVVAMPESGINTIAGIDLADGRTLERMLFGVIVRRLLIGEDAMPEAQF
ncbi:MAG TPA: AAA family ATPase [Nannocystaceae bacterium]|nr:AAA family ATPase [Nannocystaceae bacterium]